MPAHVSAVAFVIVAMYLIIFGAMWRWLAVRYADKPIGQAMAVIY